MTDGRQLLERLDRLQAERIAHARSIKAMAAKPDRRGQIAQRIAQGLVILLCLYVIALGLSASARADCHRHATEYQRSACEYAQRLPEWRDHPDEAKFLAWRNGDLELAQEFDAGKLSEGEYWAARIELALTFGKLTDAAEADRAADRLHALKEREIRAMERAASAAEMSAKIEAQKLCLRTTGRLCVR